MATETPNLGKERDDRRYPDWLGTPSAYFDVNDDVKRYCTRLGRMYRLNDDKGGSVPGDPNVDPAAGDGTQIDDWVSTVLDSAIVINTVNGDDTVSQNDTLLNIPVVMTFRDQVDGEVVQVTFRDSEGKLLTKPATVAGGEATVLILPGDLNGFINPILILAYIGTSPPATRLIQYGTASEYTGALAIVSQAENSESTESEIWSVVTGNVATFGELQYSLDPTFATFITRLPVQATTKYVSHRQKFPKDEGGTLTPDTTYYARWRLFDGAGDEIYSDIVPHMTLPVQGNVWSNTELYSLPPGTWTEIGASQTCYFDDTWEDRSSKVGSNPFIVSRVDFSSPDGKPAFGHVVKKDDQVEPLGIDSDYYEADFSTFNKVLMRYRHWIDKHSGIEGKWMSLHTGLGMIGAAGRGKEIGQNGIDWGTGGSGVNVMHPKTNDGISNYTRMLNSRAGDDDAYGDNTTGGPGTSNSTTILPLGEWITVDTVVEKNVGFKCYINGQLRHATSTINPVMYWVDLPGTSNDEQEARNWTDQKRIWVRVRCMHGGTPSNLLAKWDYKEWFGGMVIMTSP